MLIPCIKVLIEDGRTTLHVFVICFQEWIRAMATLTLRQHVLQESFSAGLREARVVIVRNNSLRAHCATFLEQRVQQACRLQLVASLFKSIVAILIDAPKVGDVGRLLERNPSSQFTALPCIDGSVGHKCK